MLFFLFTLLPTVCNRTWFGDIGKTYEMEINKPSTLPFLCHLNFTAAGGSHGDIIQVSEISELSPRPHTLFITLIVSLC